VIRIKRGNSKTTREAKAAGLVDKVGDLDFALAVVRAAIRGELKTE
jgi:ClpP class serine protease